MTRHFQTAKRHACIVRGGIGRAGSACLLRDGRVSGDNICLEESDQTDFITRLGQAPCHLERHQAAGRIAAQVIGTVRLAPLDLSQADEDDGGFIDTDEDEDVGEYYDQEEEVRTVYTVRYAGFSFYFYFHHNFLVFCCTYIFFCCIVIILMQYCSSLLFS